MPSTSVVAAALHAHCGRVRVQQAATRHCPGEQLRGDPERIGGGCNAGGDPTQARSLDRELAAKEKRERSARETDRDGALFPMDVELPPSRH
jgi:hypothetical protein